MLKFYLVRHGWTAWHSERRVAGWADVPLDERGHAEAIAASRWLRANTQPLALVSSPVLRARQTSEHIAAAFNPPLTLKIEEGIGETRVPNWQGRLVDEITASDPAWPDFYKGPADFRFPGGETGREVQARAVAVIEALHHNYEQGDLILVAHAEPLRGIIAHYLGMDANHYYRLRINCGSISRISLTLPGDSQPRPKARLDLLNLTEHLRDSQPLPDGEAEAKGADLRGTVGRDPQFSLPTIDRDDLGAILNREVPQAHVYPTAAPPPDTLTTP